MEPRTLQTFLRVLYTVNGNPQYILVKSSSQVPAITCTETTAPSAKNEPAYARTPLKACLTAVCDSSPELLQDPARDFSLYVLDPLEARPLLVSMAQTPHDTGSPRGVAVALGLMSWALESNDSTNVFVTGTIIPHPSPALEVVFALRETKRMPKLIFHSYPSLGSISEQPTLTRSADFPELYIGPPRRARGRPEGSTSSKSKVTPQAPSLSGTSSSKVVETQSESKEEMGRRSKHKTRSRVPRALPTYSPFVCTPLSRHTATRGPEGGATGVPALYQRSHPFSQTQIHPQAQPSFFPIHNPLLGSLSVNPSTSSGNETTNDGDSDIVVLDSSTIDTTAFCKPSTWMLTASAHHMSPLAIDREPPTATPEVETPISKGPTERGIVTASRSSSSSTHRHPTSLTANKSGSQSTAVVSSPSKSKTDDPGTTDAPLNGIALDTTSLKRRRTLNEFMAEHEARKNAKVRKRTSSGRKLEADVSANASQVAPSRSSKLVSTTRHAQSSPSRPLFRSDSVASSLPASTRQPALVPGAPAFSPALSPITTLAYPTSTSTTAPTKNPLKNFVLPAWARTSTAMLPRLSGEALARQRAERETKKAQASSRRREAARAKRKQLHSTERPSKESSDEDDEAVVNDAILRTLHPNAAQSIPSLPLPLPSLPVFASDAVEPIPSSPPQSHRQLAPPVVPSTPPRKSASPGSAPHCTPSKSGSCSLFTPSGKDPGSLFTPSTPSVTRSLTQVTFTPRSPTVHHRSGARKSPRKSMPQTPKRNSGNHQTPRSLHAGRNQQFVSPSSAIRMPQTQMGMGMRAFLLPPPSPCAQRTSHLQKQAHSKVPGGSTPAVSEDSGTIKQESPSDERNVEPDEGCKEEDMINCKQDDVLRREYTPITPEKWSPDRPTVDDGQGISELRDISSNDDASQVGEEYPSSPLPPSSPPSASAFSSPAKHHHSDFNTPTINNLILPDSDILLPSASDSDGPQGAVDTTWLSNDAYTTSWLADSEASAWFTETEAWLTDTEGGPLLTDSDAAWLSDSDAVFGDMSSLPPSSASNWLSDDAEVDTDGEFGTMEGRDGGLDAAVFEKALAALVVRGGQAADHEEAGTSGTAHGARVVESEIWASMPPLWEGNAIDAAGTAPGNGGGPVDEDKVAQDIQELLDGLVGT